jgi:hypothetical protein
MGEEMTGRIKMAAKASGGISETRGEWAGANFGTYMYLRTPKTNKKRKDGTEMGRPAAAHPGDGGWACRAG